MLHLLSSPREDSALPPSERPWSDAPTIPPPPLSFLLVQCILSEHSVMEHSLLMRRGP